MYVWLEAVVLFERVKEEREENYREKRIHSNPPPFSLSLSLSLFSLKSIDFS